MKWVNDNGDGWLCGFIQSENKYHITFIEDYIGIWDSTKGHYSKKIGTINLSDADSATLNNTITGNEKITNLINSSNEDAIYYFYRDLFNKNL